MTRNNTFKVVKRIVIFTFLLVVLDFLIGSGLEYLYFKQKVGLYARTTYGLEQTTADLLIFGSSSANRHYNPAIFEKTLDLSTYNEGRDGIEILYHSALLKGILSRYSPKIVLLNITPNELTTYRSYDALSSLLPYHNKHPEMQEIISLRSRFENWKLYSKIYPYNSTFLTMLNGIYKTIGSNIQDKGYVPLFGTLGNENSNEVDISNFPIDTNRVKALNGFIDHCKEKNISVYLIFSPVYSFDHQETKTISEVLKISEEKEVYFYNFIHDTRFKGQKALFKDWGHLNHDGATKFSEIVAEIIFDDLKKSNSTALSLP